MFRWPIAFTLCALLMAGCEDRHRRAVRREVTRRGLEDNSQAEASEGAGPTSDRRQPAESTSREVDLGTMGLTAPDDWIRNRPAISFILAEFSLPRAEGDAADARLTVSAAGGSIEENVERWRRQFGEKPEKESVQQVEISGVQVTVSDFSGIYSDQPGPFATPVKRADYRMLGAIIPLEKQLYFVKCYGPKKTLAERADEFDAFLRSLRSKQSAR